VKSGKAPVLAAIGFYGIRILEKIASLSLFFMASGDLLATFTALTIASNDPDAAPVWTGLALVVFPWVLPFFFPKVLL
jgi:hypothetical protein